MQYFYLKQSILTLTNMMYKVGTDITTVILLNVLKSYQQNTFTVLKVLITHFRILHDWIIITDVAPGRVGV